MRLARLLIPWIAGAWHASAEEAVGQAKAADLTSATFAPTVASGLWFVKFYSPYCGHCKKLAPSWQQVEEKYNGKGQGITLAAVDCIAQQDLCAENSVQGYPTMLLFKDGKRVADLPNYTVDDTVKMIDDFVVKQLKDQSSSASATATSSSSASKQSTTPDKKKSEAGLAKKVFNPEGISLELTTDTFAERVTDSKDLWFIKFYTTWCTHCQKLAPTWNELGVHSKGRLNIGQVDCDKEAKLCTDHGVRGFPTLLVFKGDQHVEYNGLRGIGDLIAYANKVTLSQVQEVDAADLEAIQKKNEVVFLYFYDFASTTEDFEALDRTALSLIGHAPLLKTDSTILASKFRISTFPKLAVIKDGRPQYYNALGPRDLRDVGKMSAWMKSSWLPLVPELSAQTAHEIMGGRMVVLGVLDPLATNFEQQKRILKETAQQVAETRLADERADRDGQREKKEEVVKAAMKTGDESAIVKAKQITVRPTAGREVGFAWVDGVFWSKWLKATYKVDVLQTGANALIIHDEDRGIYWDVDGNGKPLVVDKEAILANLKLVLDKKLKGKSAKTNLQAAYHAAKKAGDHPVTTGFFVFGSLATIVWILTRRAIMRRHHAYTLKVNSRESSPFDAAGKLD